MTLTYLSSITKRIKHCQRRENSLALEEQGRATLGPPGLVAATRHVETRDSLVTVSAIVDWD